MCFTHVIDRIKPASPGLDILLCMSSLLKTALVSLMEWILLRKLFFKNMMSEGGAMQLYVRFDVTGTVLKVTMRE